MMIRQQRLRQEVQVLFLFGGGMSHSAFLTICFLVTSSLSHIFYHLCASSAPAPFSIGGADAPLFWL